MENRQRSQQVWKMYEDNNQLVHDPRNEATVRLRRIKTNLWEYKNKPTAWKMYEDKNQLVHGPRNETTIRPR